MFELMWKLIENWGNFEYKNDHKNKNKNRKIDFLFYSAHCASFMKMGAKLRGGGGGSADPYLGQGLRDYVSRIWIHTNLMEFLETMDCIFSC